MSTTFERKNNSAIITECENGLFQLAIYDGENTLISDCFGSKDELLTYIKKLSQCLFYITDETHSLDANLIVKEPILLFKK